MVHNDYGALTEFHLNDCERKDEDLIDEYGAETGIDGDAWFTDAEFLDLNGKSHKVHGKIITTASLLAIAMRCPSLKTLTMNGTSILLNATMGFRSLLEACSQLEALNLSSFCSFMCPVIPSSMLSLKVLDVSGCAWLDNASLSTIAQMAQLECLDVTNTNVTARGLAQILHGSPRLGSGEGWVKFNFDGTMLSREFPHTNLWQSKVAQLY